MLTPEEEKTVEEEINRLINEEPTQTQFISTGSLLQLFVKLKEIHDQSVQDVDRIIVLEKIRDMDREELENKESQIKYLQLRVDMLEGRA